MDFVTGTWVMAAVGLVLVIVARIYLKNPQKITVLKHIFHQAGGTVVPLPKGKVTVSVSLPFI
ncbi:hypothetical protein AN239_04495 [Neisseria gonorrhoeae]|nr:hypothetical protein AN239_04495 [Neisseria gonorrhoeae]